MARSKWARKINPGKPLPRDQGGPTPAELVRFLGKVRVEQLLPLGAGDSSLEGPCWVWTGGTDPRGYGFFKWRGRKVWANRFSHEAFRGPVPDGEDVDHLCFCPACVNPAHLASKTPAVNRGRKKAAAAVAAAAEPESPQPWQAREEDEDLAVPAFAGAEDDLPF